MMNFEQQSLEKADMEKAFKKSREMSEKWRIRESDFVDPYGEDSVRDDLNHIKKLQNKFGEKSDIDKESEVFETIIFHQAELQNWLGSDAQTILPSKFDDIVNGVDCLVEFGDEKQGVRHLALAIDVTFSSDPSVISEKIEGIEDEIRSGQLTEVKYFESDRMGYKGKLEQLPRVVIGADRGSVKDLIDLWLNKDNPELEKHWVQGLILEEARMQLESFRDYAKNMGRDEAAERYTRALNIIKTIIREKDIDPAKVERNDSTFRTMKQMLS